MQNPQQFQRTLGLPAAISIVAGSMIGSGIFMRPAEMAGLLGSPLLILAVWVIAGVFTLFAAMVSAEIGAMLPQTGGQYIFMRHMYGRFWSYLFGWANFSVINTAGTAGIAFIFGQYLEYFFKLPRFSPAMEQSVVWHVPMVGDILPLENIGVKGITLLVLAVFTTVNYISTRAGSRLQVFFTVAKVLAIVLLTGGLFLSGSGSFSHFQLVPDGMQPSGIALVAAMVAACNGALQSYDGWGNMVMVAGEIKQPGRNIPRSLVTGIGLVIFIYLAISAAMIYMLPVDRIAGSQLVASDAAAIAFGKWGAGIIAILICLSVLGATQGSVLTPPRMTFAMAGEGNFFKWAGKVHPKHRTPGNALLLHFLVMTVMVFSGSFYILTDMYIFVAWLFNLMMISGVFILRKKMPYAERPYRVWGYPWVPLVLLTFTAFYLGFTLYNDISAYTAGKTRIMNSVLGLVLTAAGIPFYLYFRWKYKNTPDEEIQKSE
jgi:APA family basic amino acid/polyamine antiporter